MMGEFKTFVTRGNVVDLAVGVIIGGAFGRIVLKRSVGNARAGRLGREALFLLRVLDIADDALLRQDQSRGTVLLHVPLGSDHLRGDLTPGSAGVELPS